MIGITGGIGSGKSVVSGILRTLGYEVYDCDYEARRIMDSSVQLKEDIKHHLGECCVTDGGDLNRSKIAEIVFADDCKRQWLNSRVHSLVKEDIIRRLENVVDNKPFFVESAILKTSGLDRLCNEIWVVTAPQAICLERACNRDGLHPDKVRQRMNAQKDEFENFPDDKIIRTIDNSGSKGLLSQIRKRLGGSYP